MEESGERQRPRELGPDDGESQHEAGSTGDEACQQYRHPELLRVLRALAPVSASHVGAQVFHVQRR